MWISEIAGRSTVFWMSPVKVKAAEKAIRDRLQELVKESYDFCERQALINALATIAVLKRELDDDVASSLTIVC